MQGRIICVTCICRMNKLTRVRSHPIWDPAVLVKAELLEGHGREPGTETARGGVVSCYPVFGGLLRKTNSCKWMNSFRRIFLQLHVDLWFQTIKEVFLRFCSPRFEVFCLPSDSRYESLIWFVWQDVNGCIGWNPWRWKLLWIMGCAEDLICVLISCALLLHCIVGLK